MGFLSNKIWVRIFLSHPVHAIKHRLDYLEKRQGILVNMSLCNWFRERFLKSKSSEDTVQNLHFQRKQTKFRLRCTISIQMRSNIEVIPKHRQKSSRTSWKPTRYTRKYVAFNSSKRFSKSKSFQDTVQDLHFQRK